MAIFLFIEALLRLVGRLLDCNCIKKGTTVGTLPWLMMMM